MDGYLRLTEQGEVIQRKYGIHALVFQALAATVNGIAAGVQNTG